MSTKHSIAAAMFMQDRNKVNHHNQTFWSVRVKRDKMRDDVPEWEDLRQMASELKLYSNSHLDELLVEFEKNATANGAIVHWAKDAEEYRDIIFGILKSHDVKSFVKSKSMLSEECELDPYLISKGIDTIETDLGERILQLMKLPPSHIVMPAIHITKEQVGETFVEKMDAEPGNNDPTYLTHVARRNLRNLFLHADAAMTGANFAIASTGDCVVCTNEGNADMGMSSPKLNITAFGIDKIVPNQETMGVLTRLLARCGTGQPTTTYTSHFRGPREGGEYHIIIVDNGRSKILGQPDHYKLLNCLRCGACMNTCPVYRRAGGYSYTYFIPGPVGINLGMAHNPDKYYDNVSACSLCLSCSNVCPMKIDLGEQIYMWRQKLESFGHANQEKKLMAKGMKFIFEHQGLYESALSMAPIANGLPRFMLYNGLNAWGKGHEMMKFPKQSFNKMWKKYEVQGKEDK